MTLGRLQQEQAEWAAYNFGQQPALFALLGIVEEVGELAHANLKALQGIRGTPEEHAAAKRDAVADILIYLADYCTREGIDLEGTVEEVWAQVQSRDWKRYPKTGRPESAGDDGNCLVGPPPTAADWTTLKEQILAEANAQEAGQ